MERLVRALRRRGLSVAVVKHSDHAPELAGKDTDRFERAGARWVVFSGPRSFVTFRGEFSPHVRDLPCDVVLVEGYSRRRLGSVRVEVPSPRDVPRIARELLRGPVGRGPSRRRPGESRFPSAAGRWLRAASGATGRR